MGAAARVQAPAHPPRYAGLLRVTGTLTAPAQLRPTATQPQHLVLCVRLQPAQGLPYVARVDLGTDVAEHLDAQQLLPQLCPGAVVSVAGQALDLLPDTNEPALRVLGAFGVVVLDGPRAPAEPDLFSPSAEAQAA